jgi:hypothetical protein
VLELCVAALKVREVSLALLGREIARQTLHERLRRLKRDGPLDVAPRWHELTQGQLLAGPAHLSEHSRGPTRRGPGRRAQRPS